MCILNKWTCKVVCGVVCEVVCGVFVCIFDLAFVSLFCLLAFQSQVFFCRGYYRCRSDLISSVTMCVACGSRSSVHFKLSKVVQMGPNNKRPDLEKMWRCPKCRCRHTFDFRSKHLVQNRKTKPYCINMWSEMSVHDILSATFCLRHLGVAFVTLGILVCSFCVCAGY